MIYQNVINFCNKNSMSIAEFERKCGIGNGTVARWEDGKSTPNFKTLEKMKDATGIPVAGWLESEK